MLQNHDAARSQLLRPELLQIGDLAGLKETLALANLVLLLIIVHNRLQFIVLNCDKFPMFGILDYAPN